MPTQDNYPRADLTVLDLSPYYLQEARANLRYWADKRAPKAGVRPAGRARRHRHVLPAGRRRGHSPAGRLLRRGARCVLPVTGVLAVMAGRENVARHSGSL